jgi:hypothetical protein
VAAAESRAIHKVIVTVAGTDLSSRWFAFALAVAVGAIVRDIAWTLDASGPHIVLRALWLLPAIGVASTSAIVIMSRYLRPRAR